MNRKIVKIFSLIVAAVLLISTPVLADTFTIDPQYSNIFFRIRHLSTKNTGWFEQFTGEIVLDETNTKILSIWTEIDVKSINSRHEARDNDLRSAKFFDSDQFPVINFKYITSKDNKMYGDLTMKGVTKEVELDYELGKVSKDQFGRTKVGLSAKGTLNRKDFGITWDHVLDSGDMLIGEEVELDIEIEGLLK